MATLKISDLSVGDWVRYKGKECAIAAIYMAAEGYPHEVALTYQGICCGLSYIDYLEPIPITAEILEKNGFERLLERDLFYHSESGLEVAFEDGEWMHTINLHEYTIHTISGVHHIQHLLRLYGCEKEINL